MVTKQQTATQSQKLMIFVLTMSLYGLATLFTELIPKFQVGIVEFSVEYFLFIPLVLAILLIRCQLHSERLPENWYSVRSCWDSLAGLESWKSLLQSQSVSILREDL